MSFSMTTEAVRDRSKTVTRRLGWWDLQPGTILQAVEKAQGLRKGEHVKPICVIRVVSVSREPLSDIYLYDGAETAREGFPHLWKDQFMMLFELANRCSNDTPVNRIEFEYLGGGETSHPEEPR